MDFEFNHTIMHDLKEPIRSINALATIILQEDALSTDVSDMVLKIKDRSNQLHNMLEAIKTISTFGSDSEETKEIDLNSMITSTFKKLHPLQNIELNIEKVFPKIIGKKLIFIKLFEILLENSINFMDKEKGRIVISHEFENNLLKVSVKDNGIGIPKYSLTKIYDLFQSSPTPNGDRGIGLGLTLAKKIIENLGGKISVESTEGEGSIFKFTLNIESD